MFEYFCGSKRLVNKNKGKKQDLYPYIKFLANRYNISFNISHLKCDFRISVKSHALISPRH